MQVRVRSTKIEVRCASTCEMIIEVRVCVHHTVNLLATQRLQKLLKRTYLVVFLRLEFQFAHPILMRTLATDQKRPLSHFHISYQNSKISWQKLPISDFQSQFSMPKIIRIFPKKIFAEEYHFRDRFFVIHIFWKLWFLRHFSTKIMSIFCQLISEFW